MTRIGGVLRNAYDASPEPVRRVAGALVNALPAGLVYGRAYRRTLELLRQSEDWGIEQHLNWQVEQLRSLLLMAGERVPYYRRLFRETSFDPQSVSSLEDIQELPLLTREMVRELGSQLVPEGTPPSAYRYQTTGGTSGRPLGFAISHEASAAEWAFMTYQWARVGYRRGSRRVVVRGRAISGRERGKLWEFDPATQALHFSSFDLSPANMDRMVAVMQRYRPEFLHAYPSSATILAGHLEHRGLTLPTLKGLLLGSENFAPWQREYVERVFGVRAYTWYGHSEKCILAGECERDILYHPFAEYGVTELVSEDGVPITVQGRRGLLVGTSFINRQGSILIRYLTDDTAEWDLRDCDCGRSGRRLKELRGRWTQESLVAADGTLIPMTAVNLHSRVYERMVRFRFVQEQPGVARLLFVPVEDFSERDERELAEELRVRLAGRVDVIMEQVTDLPLTASGKYTFVDQRIDIGSLGTTIGEAQ